MSGEGGSVGDGLTPAAARALFPITATRAYLFSGGLAPAATPVRAALDGWTDGWMHDPISLYRHYQAGWEAARQRFAAIIGAEPEEIAIVDHTSRGSNLIVQMIDAPPGGNVVVDATTFPSSRYPWLLAGKRQVELRHVPARDDQVPLDALRAAIDARTVAVSVTHVSNMTGFRHDLAAIATLAQAVGASLIVDAAQSAGALAIDVRRMGIDFLSAGAMKWLLGPPGVGFLFVARRHLAAHPPPHVGVAGLVRPPGAPPTAPPGFAASAQRYETGMPSLPGLAAARAGMDILLAVGMAAVERHILDLSDQVVEALRQRDLRLYTRPERELRAGVIALPVHDGAALMAFLRARAVDVWADGRLLRIDPHVFNNRQDIDHLLDGLDEFVARHGRAALQASARQ